jgi:hypothetical protein
MVIGILPSFCLSHCVKKWEEAMRSPGEYDDYQAPTDECNHNQYEVGHSHEGLHRMDNGAERIYALVDQCQGCYTELAETSYAFECPYSKPEVDVESFRRAQIEQEMTGRSIGFLKT